MARTQYESVDDYVAAQPAPTRAALECVRATLRKALPGSTEGISYQIPVYKLDGSMVLYFAGYRRHYSIYPATPYVIAALKSELAGFVHSKATLRFALKDAVPTSLIARIAKLRAAEAAAPKRTKAAKKKAATKAGSKPRRKATKAQRTSKV